MTVRCSQCGEEMLGAVNRCWRCGAALAANGRQGDLPPLRRPAPAADLVVEAEVLTAADSDAEEALRGEPVAADVVVADRAAPPPAAAAAGSEASKRSDRDALAPSPRSLRPSAATGGAVGSLLLGVLGLIISWFTAGAAVLALTGLVLGAWGTGSNRRRTALAGMLLCGLALLLSSYFGLVWTYTQVYGRSPFEAAPVVEEDFLLDEDWDTAP